MTILPLAARPEAGPWLAARFKAEWPDFFASSSPEEIEREYFRAALEGRELPLVLVAETAGRPCGTVAIRATGPDTHPGPWLSGLWVDASFRNRGIGAELTRAMTAEAWDRGYPELYAATATAHRLFRRLGWEELGDFPYHGVTVAVFRVERGRIRQAGGRESFPLPAARPPCDLRRAPGEDLQSPARPSSF